VDRFRNNRADGTCFFDMALSSVDSVVVNVTATAKNLVCEHNKIDDTCRISSSQELTCRHKFTRLCRNIFTVWRKVLCDFCCKFTTLSSSESIFENRSNLTKLEGYTFFGPLCVMMK